ncbi:integral membrane protein MviN [Thermincola ferriacetica]|uniref:Probable lipid II flippase MurJ n=1 Tax=Thermincola ferriacetica TaxID=281456 RepID=A0A0L6VZY1_9FIRM|nr:murein biosynthesis integral membrane protein MurJ [Thermincola ferriacetica]KNZ68830.1 integral membrane protein MviN [Thermincola ferriacetica]
MSTGKTVAKAAGMLMVAMLVSRVLGYVREIALTSKFGQTSVTDAYIAAFTVPDLLYNLLVGGVLSSAFIPVFSSYVARNEEKDAWEVASTVINLVVIVMTVGIVCGMIFTRQLVPLVAYKFKGETLDLTVKLTRIMFPAFLLLGLNGLMMGILNSYQHFKAPAFGAIIYNLSIIVFGLALAHKFGIAAFAIGVVAGHIGNFLVQLPVLVRKGLRYKPVLNLRHPGVKRLFVLMLPAVLGLAANQINLIINQNLASGLSDGSITALRMANRLMWLPLGVFAGSIGVAIFPTMTAQVARNEISEFKKTLSLGIRSIFLIIIPAATGLMVLSMPIVRLLFEQGKFGPDATERTAYALIFYCIGLFAQSAILVITRAFYAIHNTLIPLLVACVTIVVNYLLNVTLMGPMAEGGLALAYSLSGIFNMLVLMILLRKKIGPLGARSILRSFVLIVLASAVMGAAAYGAAYYSGSVLDTAQKVNQMIQVGMAIVVGLAAYVGVTFLLKLEEADMVLGIIKRKVKRAA